LTQDAAQRPQLSLRPFEIRDEAAARAAHASMRHEGFQFLLDHNGVESWHSYLARLDGLRTGGAHTGAQTKASTSAYTATGSRPRDGLVESTLLAAVVGDQLVGRASIRHRLNEWLARWGGHIGYVVVPEHRRRGYATEILRQSLIVAHSLGIDDVLVTCDVSNIGSAKVIEACGGELESVIDGPEGAERKRRYWIRRS
jgi:predicted acetyltransferase